MEAAASARHGGPHGSDKGGAGGGAAFGGGIPRSPSNHRMLEKNLSDGSFYSGGGGGGGITPSPPNRVLDKISSDSRGHSESYVVPRSPR